MYGVYYNLTRLFSRITWILALIKERRESRWNIDGLLQVFGTYVLRQISVFARQARRSVQGIHYSVIVLLDNSTTRTSKRLDLIVSK